MKTKLALIAGTFLASLVLVGCNKTPSSSTTPVEETTNSLTTDEVSQPPVSSSTKIDDIDKEVNGTVIQEEDFSDL